MRALGAIIRAASAVVMAVSAIAAVYYVSHEDPAEEKSEKTEEKQETTEAENEEKKGELTEEQLIDLINEVSDTMLIVFQHLGRMAVDMARDGKQEEEIWKTISDRFKSTMALVEKQTCESHQIPLELYRQRFEKCSASPSKAFHNACYPCRYLLSRIENTEIEKAEVPEDLTVSRVILLNQAIIELSCRCIDRIKGMLCEEMKVDVEELKKHIASSESLKDQVFDLVVDAEKGSKKKVLEDENSPVQGGQDVRREDGGIVKNARGEAEGVGIIQLKLACFCSVFVPELPFACGSFPSGRSSLFLLPIMSNSNPQVPAPFPSASAMQQGVPSVNPPFPQGPTSGPSQIPPVAPPNVNNLNPVTNAPSNGSLPPSNPSAPGVPASGSDVAAQSAPLGVGASDSTSQDASDKKVALQCCPLPPSTQSPYPSYPAQPGYQPSQPSYPQPSQPGYQPSQPGYPPQPYQPSQPGYQPSQPGYPPQPGYQPSQPSQPGYQPSQPGYQPSQPGYQPSQPSYPPQPYQPTQPGYQPSQPYPPQPYQPSQPGYQPSQPYPPQPYPPQPYQPGYPPQPYQPGYQPSYPPQPGYQPSQPGQSSYPIGTVPAPSAAQPSYSHPQYVQPSSQSPRNPSGPTFLPPQQDTNQHVVCPRCRTELYVPAGASEFLCPCGQLIKETNQGGYRNQYM